MFLNRQVHLENLPTDIRYALKSLGKTRAFTAAALLTMALCIGANSAIFSVFESVLLRPLPFPESERLVTLYNSYPKAGAPRGSAGAVDYFDRLEGTTAFASLALVRERGFTVGERGTPERIVGAAVTPSFFTVLGIPMMRGRGFSEAEGEPGNNRKVVLSYGLWQERFGGRPDAIGGTLRIEGELYEIVGIAPRGFYFRDAGARLWTPLAFSAEDKSDDKRHNNNYQMIARLKPAFTLAQAQGQIDALNRRLDERFPQFHEILVNAGYHTVVTGIRSDLVRDVKSTLLFLQGGVLLVLLIGCVNIANLLLVRSTARTRELATRAALGAKRGRLVRQMLTESLVLACLGGVLGLGLGWVLVRAFARAGADLIPRGAEVGMSWWVAGATLALAAAAGVLFGLIPVVRVLRANLSSVFREEGRSGTASRSAVAVRGALVVTQVSIAFALLIGAGLMIASFVKTLGVNPGFKPDNVVTASIALSPTRYTNEEQIRVAVKEILERVRAVPGVESAGAADVIPFIGDLNSSVFTAADYVPKPGESLYSPPNSVVTPGYFESMGIELVRGRLLNESDTKGSQPVYVIDEWLANRFWPNQDPIGKQAFQGVRGVGLDSQIVLTTIVGIVKSVRLSGFNEDEPSGHYYAPHAQQPKSQLFLTVRTRVDPATVSNALRSAVASFDPDLPAYNILTMNERMSESLAADRMRLLLLIGFAAIALFLAGVGLYGVLAYTVAQRTNELGIRMALGSSSRGVFGLVLGHGLKLTGIGLAIGLGVSLALARLIRGLLFNVQPNDPIVFVGVLIVLSATAALACVLPARRATRIDPLVALQN